MCLQHVTAYEWINDNMDIFHNTNIRLTDKLCRSMIVTTVYLKGFGDGFLNDHHFHNIIGTIGGLRIATIDIKGIGYSCIPRQLTSCVPCMAV